MNIKRNDFKIKFLDKEIDLSFANEITINKKHGYMDEVTVKIYADNEYIENNCNAIYVNYKNKKYLLTETGE